MPGDGAGVKDKRCATKPMAKRKKGVGRETLAVFFSFAVWWKLWVKCETELGVRDLLSRVDSFRCEFVVSVFFL